MTRRRNTINIYDYPEHLNPFREDADDRNETYNTTGPRRSPFRVNAWNVFSPNKGKSKASQDTNSVSSGAASRFMTWTPRLLRKASFLRSSSPSRPSQVSPISSRLLHRTTASRSSLPPSLRSTPHSSCSQCTLPPSDSRHTSSSSRTTSPPGRPAPPRTTPSPSRPLSPPSITPPVKPSTENAPNNVNTENRQMTPVPATRRALFPASSSEKTASEQLSVDETKYTQQGAKPKKKRRAPAPPTASHGKSATDRQQLNLNESDASMTSSVTSSSAEEPQLHERSAASTSDLDVITQKPELVPRNTQLYDPEAKEPESAGKQSLNSENRLPEKDSANGVKEIGLKNTCKEKQEFEHAHVNGLAESCNQIDGKEAVRKNDETTTEEDEAMKHVEAGDYPSYKNKPGSQKLQRTSENELQENLNQSEDGHRSRQQDWKICNMKHSLGNVEHRKQLDDSVQDTEITDPPTENTCRLQNIKICSTEGVGLQNGEKLNTENKEQSKQLTPEAKPRTLLPNGRQLKETICYKI